MKYCLLVSLLAGLGAAVVVADLARSAALPSWPATRPAAAGALEAQESEEPLLLLDEEPLPDEAGGSGSAEGPAADNSRCHVCHLNYQEERMAAVHARGDVGCEDCHGDSAPHCSDEDNVTAPDRMYLRPGINTSCMGECHVILTAEHQPFQEGRTFEKLCTDCHDFSGHRLAYRTRRWNKDTGELLWSDNVRMSVDTTP